MNTAAPMNKLVTNASMANAEKLWFTQPINPEGGTHADSKRSILHLL